MSNIAKTLNPSVAPRFAKILRAAKGKRVLHVGCADSPYTERRLRENSLLHSHLVAVADNVIGIDIDSEGLALLARHNRSWELHCSHRVPEALTVGVDLIVATELIEHLPDPGAFLRDLRASSGQSVRLLLSTPNAYGLKASIRALAGQEYCHPDHTVCFSPATLSQLLAKSGWRVIDCDYYDVPARGLLGVVVNPLFALIRMVASPRSQEGLIVVAQPC
jgi:2-polyprenyl-3-methyl-5-hydroxy-6-metoxy-1,4-benzoquinol methylase